MQNPRTQVALVTLGGLVLFLPFLAQQYDVNGITEAFAVESGQLFHKNHMLYRLVGYAAYRGLQFVGYSGRAIAVLQAINAISGALGLGFAYLTYKQAAQDTLAAISGALLLGCSFIYWLFSTDVAYITLAAAFASSSMAMLLCSRHRAGPLIAGILTALSILTWQASVFLIPALCLLSLGIGLDISRQKRTRAAAEYAATACTVSGVAYLCVAYAQHGVMTVWSLATWFTSYGERGTLPMWGKWQAPRVISAAQGALWSIVPTPLAVPLSEISRSVQLGRIAVDLAIVAFAFLILLAALKTRSTALWFLVAYFCFVPFIVWWDPFDPKWFFIPNLFLAGFFACALTPWLRHRFALFLIFGSLLFIAATNFITTIRPRHSDLGPDRRIAQCVAEKMSPNDLLLSAEWGWPDYLEYLYGRRSISLISNSDEAGERLNDLRRTGGRAYMPDPKAYSNSHLEWLQSQSGVTTETLNRLAGPSAFSCYGRTILSVAQ